MDSKKIFKTEGVKYNLDANSYVLRIGHRKENSYARIILEKEADKDLGKKFIKPSKVSSLGWGTRNPERNLISIVTFNMPKKGIAYKMIYDGNWNRVSDLPIKIFASVEEGKWKVVDNPSKDLIQKFKKERDRLLSYRDPSREDDFEQEASVIYR